MPNYWCCVSGCYFRIPPMEPSLDQPNTTVRDFKRVILDLYLSNLQLVKYGHAGHSYGDGAVRYSILKNLLSRANKLDNLSDKSTLILSDFVLFKNRILNDEEELASLQLPDQWQVGGEICFDRVVTVLFVTFPIQIEVGRYSVDDIIWNQHTIFDLKQAVQKKHCFHAKSQNISICGEETSLENDRKLCDIQLTRKMVTHDGTSIKFGLKIVGRDDDTLMPVFVVNNEYREDEDTKKEKLNILNSKFTCAIALIIYDFSTMMHKTAFFVNGNNKISTEIVPWDDARFFAKTRNGFRLIDCNETFVAQKLQKDAKLYLYKNKINLKIRCPYFYDEEPLNLSIFRHQTMKDVREQIAAYFKNDARIKAMVEKYQTKFNEMLSKLNHHKLPSKHTKTKRFKQFDDHFEIRLDHLSLRKQYKYATMEVGIGDIITKSADYFRLSGCNDAKLVMSYDRRDTLFAVPSNSIQLIVKSVHESDMDQYFVVEVALNCLCLRLYKIIAQHLNVDINTILLLVSDAESNQKTVIECNSHKSMEDYSLFTKHVCIDYQLYDDIKSCNKMKNADYWETYYDVCIEYAHGPKMYISAPPHCTVKDLKKRIEAQHGLRIDQQRLYAHGARLLLSGDHEDSSLGHFGGKTIYLKLYA